MHAGSILMELLKLTGRCLIQRTAACGSSFRVEGTPCHTDFRVPQISYLPSWTLVCCLFELQLFCGVDIFLLEGRGQACGTPDWMSHDLLATMHLPSRNESP